MCSPTEHVEQEGMRAGVVAARAASTEPTGPQGRLLAGPAIQPSRSLYRRAEPGSTDIMRRSPPEFAHRLAGLPHEPRELVAAQRCEGEVGQRRYSHRARAAEKQRQLAKCGSWPEALDDLPSRRPLRLP